MSIDWRVYGPSTVVSSLHKSELNGFFRNIVVGPNEAAVIIRDGEIETTLTGTRSNTSGLWDNFKKLWGRSSDLQVIYVDTAPIDLTFYIGKSSRQESGTEIGKLSESREDAYKTIEDRTRARVDKTDLTISALTNDGQHISAEISLTLHVLTNDAQLLTTLLRGGTAIADWDIAALVKDELLAKAFVPVIGQHAGSEIRGNQVLLKQISQSAESLLTDKFELFGLELINMYVNWGLTDEDELVIEEGRKDREARAIDFDHTRKIREQERELELERQRVSNLTGLKKLEAEGEAEEAEMVLASEIDREHLVDGKRISQEKITAQVKEIKSGIAQKEELLRIETEKTGADARFAIAQRQALFDQELKQREEERRQQRLDSESQRDFSEMRDLTRLQTERQETKRLAEQEAARQSAEADHEKLKTRLDASQARSQEEQRTLREVMGASGSADPSVLREMLRQGTDREFTEATDAKMESRSKAQRAKNQSELLREQQDMDAADSKENAEPGRTNAPHQGKSVSVTEPTCESCSSLIQTGWKVCPSCGTPIERRCSNCSTKLQAEWNNCPVCGLDTNP